MRRSMRRDCSPITRRSRAREFRVARRALVQLAVLAGLPLLSQCALEILRLAAYGHLLPNSVYYKVGAGGHSILFAPNRFLLIEGNRMQEVRAGAANQAQR